MTLSPPQTFRDQSLAARRLLTPVQVRELSERSVNRFLDRSANAPWHLGMKVALYKSMNGELELFESLVPRLKKLGADLCFPKVINPESGTMELVSVPDPEAPNSWVSGFFNLPEPAPHLTAVLPHSLNVIFVPGVAFGLAGERIGMGAGFYDRYLSLVPRAIRIALAYDFQVFPELPQEPWDQRMEWVLSINQEYQSELAKRWAGGLML